MTFETMRPEDLPGAHIYEQQEKVKQGLTVSLQSVLRRMRMEDRRPVSDESYAGVDSQAGAAQSAPQAMPQGGINPADEINSILNAAHSNPNSSLTPQQTPPMAPRQAAPPPLRQPAPAPAAPAPKPANRAGSLINSFRGK